MVMPGIDAIAPEPAVGIAHAYPLSTKTSWSKNSVAKVANHRRRVIPNTNASPNGMPTAPR